MVFRAGVQSRQKINNCMGGAHIHIFGFCIFNFLWNQLFLQSACEHECIIMCPPPPPIIDLLPPPQSYNCQRRPIFKSYNTISSHLLNKLASAHSLKTDEYIHAAPALKSNFKLIDSIWQLILCLTNESASLFRTLSNWKDLSNRCHNARAKIGSLFI